MRPQSNLRPLVKKWFPTLALLLAAWGFRLCCLDSVPPGWRDDELINIHVLSGQLLTGRFPLYFTGASGHEPLYHYLHAGVHAVLGFNVLSGHILSIACGTLSIALTYALARRLFGHTTAIVAALDMTTSFWSLMYSRTAIRHIILLPFALAIFYLLCPAPDCKKEPSSSRTRKTWPLIGLLLGVSLYTYFASRLLPVIIIVFEGYLLLFHRSDFRRRWRGLLLALAVAAALVAPMALTIIRSPGADARLSELALPLRELKGGNPGPLIEHAWKTLNMFHAIGDPEWLYNLPNRPLFNPIGAILLGVGVALCIRRWKRPRYFFLLLWLGTGLFPAFVSTPPASLSHTILAQPVAYILPAILVTDLHSQAPKRQTSIARFVSLTTGILLTTSLLTNASRDLYDYFVSWPQQDMVRLLYRADYREVARYLDDHHETTDVAVGSALRGPWDRLALGVDTQRTVAPRLFNPERALVWAGEESPSRVILTTWPSPASPIDTLLNTHTSASQDISPHLIEHTIQPISSFPLQSPVPFSNGLELTGIHWHVSPALTGQGQDGILLTMWHVAAPLEIPPTPIVANPPPPGVYSGPRLAIFTHLLAKDGGFLTGDDGLWVDPLTLQPGDRLVQAHHLAIAPQAPDGPYTLELGLYDPKTGERWNALDAEGQPIADHVLLPVPR